MTARGRPPDKGGGAKRWGVSVRKTKTPRSPRVRGGSAVQPIRWRGDRLELLDQRLLPDKKVYVVCRTAGQVAKAYKVYRAWPSEYQIVGELDANANAVAIQSLKLESEGWEVDADTPEPEEPSF